MQKIPVEMIEQLLFIRVRFSVDTVIAFIIDKYIN